LRDTVSKAAIEFCRGRPSVSRIGGVIVKSCDVTTAMIPAASTPSTDTIVAFPIGFIRKNNTIRTKSMAASGNQIQAGTSVAIGKRTTGKLKISTNNMAIRRVRKVRIVFIIEIIPGGK
jgi:tRNA(Ser,Leu) C12 N-acetylase TAN1